jgi:LysM repeat protein
MSHSSPLVPQGSLLEQQAKGRPHLRIAVCIVAVHLVFLGGLLMQGCKRDEPPETASLTDLGPPDLPSFLTNAFAQLPGATDAPPAVMDLPPLGHDVGLPGGTSAVPADIQPRVGGVPLPPLDPEPLPSQVAVREHVVVKGDTFIKLSRDYQVTVNAISSANPGVDPVRLQIGQKLVIPPPAAAAAGTGGGATLVPADVYVVQPKDTLTKIARENGTTVEALMRLNSLTTTQIRVGQRLKLPPKASGAGASVPGLPGTGAF